MDIHIGYVEYIEELRNEIGRLQKDHKKELNTIRKS